MRVTSRKVRSVVKGNNRQKYYLALGSGIFLFCTMHVWHSIRSGTLKRHEHMLKSLRAQQENVGFFREIMNEVREVEEEVIEVVKEEIETVEEEIEWAEKEVESVAAGFGGGVSKELSSIWGADSPGWKLTSGEGLAPPQRKYSFDVDYFAPVPNTKFVFHNKLPKCGSTTMHNIVGLLSRKNNFTYWKIMSGVMKFTDEETLIQALKMRYREPFFLLQHHFWMDFNKYSMHQPTFVNMIRDPIAWFQSHYTFMRFGMNKGRGENDPKLGSDIDDCIKNKEKNCVSNQWTYIEFFCGSEKLCATMKAAYDSGDLDVKRQVLEIVKRRVVNDYFIVGILEQFEDTLQLFETMLPMFYKGAMDAWKSDYIQFRRNQTKTTDKEPLSDFARDYLEKNTLSYELDFYWFTRQLFNERVKALGITPSTNLDT